MAELKLALALSSALLEIIGVLLMANAYFNFTPVSSHLPMSPEKRLRHKLNKLRRIIVSIVSATWKGTHSDALAISIEFSSKEDVTASLRGIACIILGFVLLAINACLNYFSTPLPPACLSQ